MSRGDAPLRREAVALVAEDRGAYYVAAVCARAERGGVRAGMTLAQARAILPSLRDLPHRPEEDAREMRTLAAALCYFSPIVGPVGPDVIALDLTGCEATSGTPLQVAQKAQALVGRRGFAARCAVAPTMAAARALAWYAASRVPAIAAPGSEAAALSPLPPAALGLDAPVVARLDALGVTTVGELARLPRAPLASRFGPEVGLALDRAFGIATEPVPALREEEPPAERLEWLDPIDRCDAVAFALKKITDGLALQLEARGLGVSELDVRVGRPDGPSERFKVHLSEPRRSAGWLWTVLRARFERVDLGAGIVSLEVRAEGARRLAYGEPTLFEDRDPGARESWREFLDRCEARLGPRALGRVALADDARPEQAWRWRAMHDVQTRKEAKDPPRAAPPRPLRLRRARQPVEVEWNEDGDPVRMRAPGEAWCAVAGAVGPEHVQGGWWDHASGDAAAQAREYWIIEDGDGARRWVVREDGRTYVEGDFA